MSEHDNVDVQMEAFEEKLEIAEITLRVIREQIESLDARIAALQRMNQKL